MAERKVNKEQMMAGRKADRKHMQQMTARMEAIRDKLDADRAKMDAEMKAIKARMKVIPDKLDAYQERTETSLKQWETENKTDLEEMEATNLEPNPEKMESGIEHREVPKEEAEVKTFWNNEEAALGFDIWLQGDAESKGN
jgi:hypothetical protein